MIFNSVLETSIRSLFILGSAQEQKYSLQQIIALDHLVVHTGDTLNAPPSLHPETAQRNGELIIRRATIEEGLNLLESKGLIEKEVTSTGFQYFATELAYVLLENLTNPYSKALLDRCIWATSKYKHHGDMLFKEVYKTAFDRWAKEFQIQSFITGV